METAPKNWWTISLSIGVLVVCAVLFVVTILQFSAPKAVIQNPANSQETLSKNTVPVGTVLYAPSSSKEQKLSTLNRALDSFAPENPTTTSTDNPKVKPSSFSRSDLAHLHMGSDTFAPSTPLESELVPDSQDPVVTPLPVSTTKPAVDVKQTSESNSFSKLGSTTFLECGELAIPTGFGLAFFSLTAAREPAVACLGRAVANNCNDSSALVYRADEFLREVYVAQRPDGTCGVGAKVTEDLVSLCDIRLVLNAANKVEKPLSLWQEEFTADPGGAFASMYFSNPNAFDDPAVVTTYDCNIYQL